MKSRESFGPGDLARQHTSTSNLISGGASADYDTLKEIEDKIKNIEEDGTAEINNVKVVGELDSVDDLKVPGKIVTGQEFTVNGETVTAKDGAEVFNNYETNIATGLYAHAEGSNTKAYGIGSHSEGSGTIAGSVSTVNGVTTYSGHYAHAEGTGTTAQGMSSHAEGSGTQAIGSSSHSEGTGGMAEGPDSHAEGNGTKAYGKGAHAEGNRTTAGASITNNGVTTYSGHYAHAEGENTTASGHASHAEGGNSLAIAQYSHAEGSPAYSYGTAGPMVAQPTAYSRGSHAEGVGCIAGVQNGVGTAGYGAHAEGYTTTASGEGAHAEGIGTVASGYGTHAEGRDTIASSNYQHVQGKYNVEDNNDTFAFIIGNGESRGDRSNAFAVDWNGNIYVNNSETGVSVLDLLNRIKALEDAIASNSGF